MASYHMSVKVGKVGNGSNHSDYIGREEKYKDKGDDDLVFTESGNLPTWANSAHEFWKAADENERANGSVYREYEIALPRELTEEQRIELVKEFISNEIGESKTYTVAIHNPRASIEGGEQPHAHIMFSERILDGIDRNKEQHFKRYNSKNPERGGCKKDNPPATHKERKTELVELRKRFADLQNRHLEKHGFKERVTHLSLKDQGIDRIPEPHLGAKLAKELKADILELRTIKVLETSNVEKYREEAQKFIRENTPKAIEKLQERMEEKKKEPTPEPTKNTINEDDQFKINAYLEFSTIFKEVERKEPIIKSELEHKQKAYKNQNEVTQSYINRREELGEKPLLIGRKEWQAEYDVICEQGRKSQADATKLKQEIDVLKQKLEDVRKPLLNLAATKGYTKEIIREGMELKQQRDEKVFNAREKTENTKSQDKQPEKEMGRDR